MKRNSPPFLNAEGYILGEREYQNLPILGDSGGECVSPSSKL